MAILVGLFLVQRHGTGRIGVAFGPIIFIWFLAIGGLGLRWIAVEPAVLAAVNPVYAVGFLAGLALAKPFLIGRPPPIEAPEGRVEWGS